MYKIRSLFIPLITIVLLSCGRQTANRDNNTIGVIDNLLTYLEEKEGEPLIENTDWDSIDSIRLDKILIEALDILNKNIDNDIFFKEYTISQELESDIDVKIDLNYHFTKQNPHLIIQRQSPMYCYIDIYSKDDTLLNKVLSHQEWAMTYTGDTIQDINGDGYKDFVLNGYGSAGCCLKAYSLVYLFRPESSTFTDSFHFLNPTFSPKEQIIRGVCYGHPGETEMYKYKWNGERVDTVEYVYYEKDADAQKTGMILISKDCPYTHKPKVLKRLKAVPKEYTDIMGYDWFTGDFMDEN